MPVAGLSQAAIDASSQRGQRPVTCRGVHNASFWPLTSPDIIRDFFEHCSLSPLKYPVLVMPDVSGVFPLAIVRRFVIWMFNRTHPKSVSPTEVTIPWDDIGVSQVNPVNMDSSTPPLVSRMEYWIDKQLLDLSAEHQAMEAAASVYRRIKIIDRYGPAINRASVYLSRRTKTGSSSVLDTLRAYFRLASTLTVGSDEQALQWAAGYEIPEEVFTRDADMLMSLRHSPTPFSDMAHRLKVARQMRRMSVDRIQSFVDADAPAGLNPIKRWDLDDMHEDINRLMSFAIHGVPTLRDTLTAQVCGWAGRPPLRQRYVLMATVVNKSIISGWWKPGLALIFPASLVDGPTSVVGPEIAAQLHVSSLHHVLQVSKTQGRTLADSSNDIRGPDFNLNGPITKQLCKEEFGQIHLPTMAEICRMIVDVTDTVGTASAHRLVLAKGDLKGAFSLLDLRPANAALNAFEMMIHGFSYVYIPLAGYFGWTGFPYAFGVVSRVLQRLVQRSIMGDVRIYVDDLVIITLSEFLNFDLSVASHVSCELLGPGSMAEDKFDAGRQLDVLGWEIDLDSQTVRTSERNFLKGLYWFWKVGSLSRNPTVEECQKVAAYGTRYALVCPMLTPFLGPLYRMQAKVQWKHSSCSVTVDREYRRAVDVWISSLCMMHLDACDPWMKASIVTVANTYTAPQQDPDEDIDVWIDTVDEGLEHVRPNPPSSTPLFHTQLGTSSYTIQVDGCLEGVGFVHWAGWWNGERGERVIRYGYLKFDDLDPPDSHTGGLKISDRQNASEVFGMLYGSVYVASHPELDKHGCHLVSDSMSALTWIHRRKWPGKDDTVRLSVAFMLLFLKHDFQFAELTHVSSEANHMADLLSRGVIPEECNGVDRWGEPSLHPFLSRLLRILHPMAHEFCPELQGPDIIERVDAAFTGVIPEWPSFPAHYDSGKGGS